MEKMLDFINKRDIEIGTIKGALTALNLLLDNYPNRIARTKGVVRNVCSLCGILGIKGEERLEIIKGAYLHDIGYSDKFKFCDFHPVDGYTYLKANGWSDTIALVALHHSYSRLFLDINRQDLKSVYVNAVPLTEFNKLAIKIVTLADLTTDSVGNDVDFQDRVKDIKTRYGETHPVHKHIKIVEKVFLQDVNYLWVQLNAIKI